MITASLAVHFPGQFVGHPYWPERDRLIEITKQSGMNRARASQNRRKALEEYLRQHGLTLADYEELERQAARAFHRDGDGRIIIPADYVLSFLVATCDEARAAMKPCRPEQVRSRFRASAWVTDRLEPDGVWQRFATVTSGTGAKLSNQRGLRENAYIEDFTATGTLQFSEEFVDPKALRNALVWGGREIGIGASRKMGKGRFELTGFETTTLPDAIAAE